METKNQICKCGHEEFCHTWYAMEGVVVSELIHCGVINCTCKKFEPKNHSPQTKQGRPSALAKSGLPDMAHRPDKPAGTLSDKIQRPIANEKGYVFEQDIKDFIKKYEEIDKELWRNVDSIMRYDIDSKIKSEFIDKEFIKANEKKDKITGDNLI